MYKVGWRYGFYVQVAKAIQSLVTVNAFAKAVAPWFSRRFLPATNTFNFNGV